MIIQNFQAVERGNEFVVEVEAKTGDKHESLWFSTPLKYKSYITTARMDGFLVGMLYPAMLNGEDIHVAGTVSEKLLHNINTYIIPLIQCYSPSAKSIRVTSDYIDSSNLHSNGVGTGFSGGIDSFAVVYDYLFKDVPEKYKLTHFIFLNVGSHGRAKTSEDLAHVRDKFYARYEFLSAFPNEVGLDFIPFDSNLHSFHHQGGHQKTHTLTTVAGVLFFQNLFHRYYFASNGLTYREIIEDGYKMLDMDISIFDTQLLPLLSTESLELIPDGQQWNRLKKTSLIVDYSPARRFLNVCISTANLSAKNCSVCIKCVRTLATLRILGVEDKFKEVFDLDKYRREVEKKYFAQLFLGLRLGLHESQIVDFAKQRNISLRRYTTAFHVCMEISVFPVTLLRCQLRKIGWLRNLLHRLKNK